MYADSADNEVLPYLKLFHIFVWSKAALFSYFFCCNIAKSATIVTHNLSM